MTASSAPAAWHAIALIGMALGEHRSNDELLAGRNFDPDRHLRLAGALVSLQALADAADLLLDLDYGYAPPGDPAWEAFAAALARVRGTQEPPGE